MVGPPADDQVLGAVAVGGDEVEHLRTGLVGAREHLQRPHDLVHRETQRSGVDRAEGDDVVGREGNVADDRAGPPHGGVEAVALAVGVEIPVQGHTRPHSQQKVHSVPKAAPHSWQVRVAPPVAEALDAASAAAPDVAAAVGAPAPPSEAAVPAAAPAADVPAAGRGEGGVAEGRRMPGARFQASPGRGAAPDSSFTSQRNTRTMCSLSG